MVAIAALLLGPLGCSHACKTDADCAGGLVCNIRSGACVTCWKDANCDDHNPCTFDACEDDACLHTVRADGVDCDDGQVCNGSATCEGGQCNHTPAPNCDDGLACTTDGCSEPGGCTHQPDDSACDDGIDCTVDACDATQGCVFEPDDTRCDDGVACTVDTCDPVFGCTSTPDDTLCGTGGTCCPDGCHSLATDPSNCGSCGHKCPDGDDCYADLCELPGQCLTARTPDPSFQDPSAWTHTNGAAVDPTDVGMDDPGYGVLPAGQAATLGTTGCVPPGEGTGMSLSFSMKPNAAENMGVSVGIPGFTPPILRVTAVFAGQWTSFSKCLGEPAYQADLPLQLTSWCGATSCALYQIQVDHLAIQPDSSCPPPGEVADGDLEGTMEWANISTTGTVQAVDDGTGNHVLKVTNTQGECGAIVQSRLSQPLDTTLANPALQFRASGTAFNGVTVDLQLYAGANLGVVKLPNDGTWNDYTLCLQSSLGGLVWDLNVDTNGGTGSVSCPTAPSRTVLLDDFTVVSDAADCP